MGRRRRSASLHAATQSLSRQVEAAARRRLAPEVTPSERQLTEDTPTAHTPRQPSARERKFAKTLARREERRGPGGMDDGEYRRTRSEYTNFTYLSAAQVEAIHRELTRKFVGTDDPIGSDGPVDGGQLLRSAVTRPHTGMRTGGAGKAKYSRLEEAGAALAHSLIHNHPFPDGNKRTATLALVAFLYENKRLLIARPDELYGVIVALAQHRVPRTGGAIGATNDGEFASDADDEVTAIGRWVRKNVVDIDRDHRRMQWRKLRTLLVRRGCRIVHGQGNSISVHRAGKRTRKSFIGARNDGDELDASTVAKVMRDLELTSLHTPLAKEREGAPTFIEEAIEDWQEVLYKLGELDRGIVRTDE